MPRRYPAPNYLPARYLGLIVIAERDPENKRKKEEEEGDRGSRTGRKAAGISRGAKNHRRFPAETMAVCFRTCLRAMRAMEVRLNIDFSYGIGKKNSRGEKPPGGTCQFWEMIP